MPTAEKTARVEELVTAMTEAKAIYLADFTGIDVAAVTALRRQLRGADTDYQVVKNRLAKLAAQNAGIGVLAPHLTGPTAVAFANGDPAAPAKILDQFITAGGKLVIKSGYVDGQLLSQDQVRALAKLPSRTELLSRVVAGVQSPLSGFAAVLSGVLRKLVGTLAALEESRRTEGGDAAAAATAP